MLRRRICFIYLTIVYILQYRFWHTSKVVIWHRRTQLHPPPSPHPSLHLQPSTINSLPVSLVISWLLRNWYVNCKPFKSLAFIILFDTPAITYSEGGSGEKFERNTWSGVSEGGRVRIWGVAIFLPLLLPVTFSVTTQYSSEYTITFSLTIYSTPQIR